MERLGCTTERPDPVAIARGCIGISRYEPTAWPNQAPRAVNCSSFVRWVFEGCGIPLPRLAIQQSETGEEIPLHLAQSGDLIFTTGRRNFYRDDPHQGVGHVGLITDDNTVIHAANARRGIVEDPREAFLANRRVRIVRRFFFPDTLVLQIPETLWVEKPDDVRWILLQNIGKIP